MSKKITIAILDDEPESARVKLAPLRQYATKVIDITDTQSWEATQEDDNYGVAFKFLRPAHILDPGFHPSPNTVFLVDVNWNTRSADFEELAGKMQLDVYGLELFQELYLEYENGQRDFAIFLCSYHPSAQAAMTDHIFKLREVIDHPESQNKWQRDLLGYLSDDELRQQHSSVQSKVGRALLQMVWRILEKDSASVRKACRALPKWENNETLDAQYLLGDTDANCNLEVGGYRLGDLSKIVTVYAGALHDLCRSLGDNNPRTKLHKTERDDIVATWRKTIKGDLLEVAEIDLQRGGASDPKTAMLTLLRYGLPGTAEARNPDFLDAEGISFVDGYLFYEDNYSYCPTGGRATRITDPLLLDISGKKGAPASLFNGIFATEINKLGTGCPKWASSLANRDNFSVQRNKEGSLNAKIRACCGKRKIGKSKAGSADAYGVTHRFLRIEEKPGFEVKCVHIEAARVARKVDAKKKITNADWDEVYRAWNDDKGHLEPLALFAKRGRNYMNGLVPENKKPLKRAFEMWGTRLTDVANVIMKQGIIIFHNFLKQNGCSKKSILDLLKKVKSPQQLCTAISAIMASAADREKGVTKKEENLALEWTNLALPRVDKFRELGETFFDAAKNLGEADDAEPPFDSKMLAAMANRHAYRTLAGNAKQTATDMEHQSDQQQLFSQLAEMRLFLKNVSIPKLINDTIEIVRPKVKEAEKTSGHKWSSDMQKRQIQSRCIHDLSGHLRSVATGATQVKSSIVYDEGKTSETPDPNIISAPQPEGGVSETNQVVGSDFQSFENRLKKAVTLNQNCSDSLADILAELADDDEFKDVIGQKRFTEKDIVLVSQKLSGFNVAVDVKQLRKALGVKTK